MNDVDYVTKHLGGHLLDIGRGQIIKMDLMEKSNLWFFLEDTAHGTPL